MCSDCSTCSVASFRSIYRELNPSASAKIKRARNASQAGSARDYRSTAILDYQPRNIDVFTLL
jgi:hypothetical protein